MKNLDRKLLILLSTIAVILINVLANSLPINGITSGEVSDKFNSFFTPAGYVFSIWGLIYILLLGFSIYQLLPKYGNRDVLNNINYLYVISCVLNGFWIFMWHYEQILISAILIILLLITLIAIYLKINKLNRFNLIEKVFLKSTFSIYLAWISVATIANIFILFHDLNIDRLIFGEFIWTIILLAITTLIAFGINVKFKDYLFPLVIAWAFMGIGIENNSGSFLIFSLSIGLSVLIILFVALSEYKRRYVSNNA